MTSDPSFHKNQSYLYNICAFYTFLFHLYCIQDDERSNIVEKRKANINIVITEEMYGHIIVKNPNAITVKIKR